MDDGLRKYVVLLVVIVGALLLLLLVYLFLITFVPELFAFKICFVAAICKLSLLLQLLCVSAISMAVDFTLITTLQTMNGSNHVASTDCHQTQNRQPKTHTTYETRCKCLQPGLLSKI